MEMFKIKVRHIGVKLLIMTILCSQVTAWVGVAATDGPQIIKTVKVLIPTYKITLNDQVYDNAKVEHPFISYKDVLYAPLTGQNCEFLGIKSNTYFQIPTKPNTLFIGNALPLAEKLDISLEPKTNALSAKAYIYDYKVALNQIAYDGFFENKLSDYPVITYKEITYLPLTWQNVVEKLDWQYSYDLETGFTLNTQDVNRPILDDHIIGVQSPHSIKQYAIFDDIYIEYPPSTLGGHYSFVYQKRGGTESSIDLRDQLEGGDYNFNVLADSNGFGYNKSPLLPAYDQGVFSIVCSVRSQSEYKNYLLKIDLEKGAIIEREPMSLIDVSIK